MRGNGPARKAPTYWQQLDIQGTSLEVSHLLTVQSPLVDETLKLLM